MYRGENQIAIASQHHISEVFLEMLKRQSFSQISIRDLCKAANVSRQTFYSLFETRENILLFVLEKQYPLSLNQMYTDNERLDVYDICQGFGEYILNAKAFLKKVVDCDLTHLITELFYRSILECDRFRVRESEVHGPDDGTMRRYYASFIAGGLTSLLKIYLEEEREMDSKDMTRLCYRLLSGKEL